MLALQFLFIIYTSVEGGTSLSVHLPVLISCEVCSKKSTKILHSPKTAWWLMVQYFYITVLLPALCVSE